MKTSAALVLILLTSCYPQARGQSYDVLYSYDKLNRLTSVTYPDGATIRYEYDPAGNRVAIKVLGVEFKGDLTPRPAGKKDGTLTIFDWVQVGRFVAGLDNPGTGNELHRADCHPRSSSGDGKLDIFDWVQAGRYVVGLDEMIPANYRPPSGALMAWAIDSTPPPRPPGERSLRAHSIRVVEGTLPRGKISEVAIELDAHGDENALAFGIEYDPGLLRFLDAVPGSPETQVMTTPAPGERGQIGLVLAQAPGRTFPVGRRTIVILRFQALSGEGETRTRIGFREMATFPTVVSAEVQSLPVSWTDAQLTITGAFYPTPSITELSPRSATAGSATLSIRIDGENFVSGSVVYWNGAAIPTRFHHANLVVAEVSDSRLEIPEVASIVVKNPEPGGGSSSSTSFVIVSGNDLPVSARKLRVVSVAGVPGNKVNVPVEITALGGENALSFTLTFDEAVLQRPIVRLGSDVDDALLIVNDSQISSGKVGIAIALPVGRSLSAGSRQLVNVRFEVTGQPSVDQTFIGLDDQPLLRAVADSSARPLAATWQSGEVSINRRVVTVSAANYEGSILAAESIVSAFGSNLAGATEIARSMPLPTVLAGTTVVIRDRNGAARPAQIFFASPTQLNFQIPRGTATGKAEVIITAEDGTISTGVVQIENVAPGLFTADATGQGWGAGIVLRVKADGSQHYEPIVEYSQAESQLVARPVELKPTLGQVYLVLFGTGLRQRTAPGSVKATIGNRAIPVLYAGEHGTFIGLDQINLLLPAELAGSGEVEIELVVDGRPANSVKILIQ